MSDSLIEGLKLLLFIVICFMLLMAFNIICIQEADDGTLMIYKGKCQALPEPEPQKECHIEADVIICEVVNHEQGTRTAQE